MSWQLRLLNMQLRLLAKPLLHRTKGPEEAERDFRRTARLFFRAPPFVAHVARPDRLHWIRCGRARPGVAMLYFHGGGYVAGSPETHVGMLGRLSKLTGIEICAPDYRLAQQTPFPAAFDDACAAWGRLMALGYRPSQVVLGGDSAGGGLALAVLSRLCLAKTPPAGLFAFSPWTDLALTGSSLRENAAYDPILPVARIRELVETYLQNADRRDPRASPLYAAFPCAPPVWLSYSETEILRDDARRVANRLRDAGALVTERPHPDAPHVWQIFDGWVPEARASLRECATFVQACLAETKR